MIRSDTTLRLAVGARPERPAGGDGRLVLGRYRLEERLGAGGFGTVWRAHDERLERDVAVKVVAVGDADDARVQREAVAAARLNHPGIVALYELGHDDRAAYLVSELVEGATLAELTREGAVADRDVARIGAALCDALAHAHARGVVHRDVKPGNVMVLAEPAAGAGFAKLTDFGIARLASSDTLTATGDVVGTLAYMAPEQAEGAATGPEADVYALALTLYEAWTGENPVRGATAAATARNIGRPLPPLRRGRRDLPSALCEALDGALDLDPRRRPDLAELREVLDEAAPQLDSEGGLVEPETLERFGLTAVLPHTARTGLTRLLRGRGDSAAEPTEVVYGGDGRRLADAPAHPGEAYVADRPARMTARDLAADFPGRAAAGAAAGALTALATGLAPGPSFSVLTAALVVAAAVALLPRVGWVLSAMGVCVWLASPEAGVEGTALVLCAALISIPLLLPRAGLLWSAAAIAPLLGAIGLAPLFVGVAALLGRSIWQRAGLAAAGLLWLRFAEAITGSSLLYGSAPAVPPRAGWEGSVVDAAREAIQPVVTSVDPLLAAAWIAGAVLLGLLADQRRRATLP